MANEWPEDKHKYVTAAQVAAYLGYPSLKAFYRDKAWRAARGFPAQPMKRRWRAWQIEAWERSRLIAEQSLPEPANETGPCAGGAARQALDNIRARLARKEASHG